MMKRIDPEMPASDVAWQEHAACRGMDTRLFFPERGGNTKRPKKICAGCEVRGICEEYGDPEKFGIWGGLTEIERRNKWAGTLRPTRPSYENLFPWLEHRNSD